MLLHSNQLNQKSLGIYGIFRELDFLTLVAQSVIVLILTSISHREMNNF